MKLVLYSEKEPEKGDTRIVDPKADRANLAGLLTLSRCEVIASALDPELGLSCSVVTPLDVQVLPHE